VLERIGLMGWSFGIKDDRSVFFRVRDDGLACGWCFADAAGGDGFKPKLPLARLSSARGSPAANR
jgi:hypothetical protein